MSGQNAPEKVKSPSFFIENILTHDKHNIEMAYKEDEEQDDTSNADMSNKQSASPHSHNERVCESHVCREHKDTEKDGTLCPKATPVRMLSTSWSSGTLMSGDRTPESDTSDDGASYSQDDILHKFRPKKKTRTVFSRHQIFYLESAFDTKKYLSSSERADIAATLNLSETQVKVWFQNRRNKWKSQVSGEQKPSGSPESSFMLPFPGSARFMNFGHFPPGFPLYRHRFLYF